MAYTINANAKNVWIRDNEDTRDLSIQTDASSVYLDNGRTLEQELGEGSMVSNVATVDSAMSKIIDGTLDGVYESGVMYGRSLVNIKKTVEAITMTGSGQYKGFHLRSADMIQDLKTDTDYLFVVNVTSNTLEGSTKYSLDFGNTDPNNPNQQAYFTARHYLPYNALGTYKFVLRTKSSFENAVFVSRNQILPSCTGGSITFSYMLLEYQEGMENWDIPFFEGLCDVKMPILRNVGANLFDINQSYDHAYSLPEKYFVENNKLHFINVGTHRNLCWWVKVSKGERIYCSCLEENNKGKIDVRFFSEKRVGDNFINRNSWRCNGAINSTICSDEWMLLMLNTSTDSGDFVFENISVSYHDTGYEDYKTNILHTPETVTLRSLPNGVRDELNLKTGEYIKRIGEVTLDGSENWKAWESNDTHCKLSLANYPSNMRINGQHTTRLVCDKLKIGNDRVGVINDNFMASVGDVAYTIIVGLELGKLTSADVAGFKQWLKENPLTVQYELAEPVVTKVALTQSEPIVKIGTELPNGVCDTYNLLTGEYIQRVGKVVLDGSEVWKNGSLTSNDGQYYVSYCPLSSMKKYTIASGVISLTSDKFIAEPPVGDDEAKRRNREFIASYGSNATVVDGESNWIYLSVEKRKIASNTGIAFADYLKSNPVTVWYELKNPIITKKNGLPNTYGVTLPNGVVDKYNESTGVYTQNLGKVVLDGSQDEEWAIVSSLSLTNTIAFQCMLSQGSSSRADNLICNSFTPQEGSSDVEHIRSAWAEDGVYKAIALFINKTKLPTQDVSGLRSYLASNNIELYYSLPASKTIDIPLINVGQVLPNGVCDTYNPITKEYVKRVSGTVLVGNEDWSLMNSPYETDCIGFVTSCSLANWTQSQANLNIVCEGYVGNYELWNVDEEGFSVFKTPTRLAIKVKRSKLSTADINGFKKFLKLNPLAVWYELATPEVSTVDLDLSTLYSSSPVAYENGHIILESGHDGQSLLPTLEYSTVTNKVKQIENIGEQVLRQEKQLTMLEQMLIQNIIGLDYNNTVLALNLEINEVM